MAISRVFDAEGWTPQQHDTLIARMNLAGHAAPGVLYHWAATPPPGMRAVDVSESREAADSLVREQIGPLTHELGLPMPVISEFEVHAILHP
jgi:hypothetical protein